MSASRAISLNRLVAFVVVAVAGVAADLVTKQLVFAWRGLPQPNNEWWLWEPYIGVETAINLGALFGMGQGWGLVFAILSLAAAVAIPVWLFYFGAARDRLLTSALSLVMGGVLGNLYDRLGLWWSPGMPPAWRTGVRDWILLRYGDYTWPNFNLADSLLVCGAALLAWHALSTPSDQSADQTTRVARPS